ncbi:AmmeMemoRadiSam system protein A [Thiovibrio sp. JS02]
MHKNDRDEKEMLSARQGKALLRLARRAISQELGMLPAGQEDDPDQTLKDNALQARRGTFVTLKKRGELRGCIGSLAASESIVEGVRSNALNAAFHDSRFSPLQGDELADIEVEVSILSEPCLLAYTDSEDLTRKLRVGVDGVILRKGPQGATFLPQVWAQLPDPEEFLSHLCRKAWLPPDAWRRERLKVYVYQVQYFEEEG